MPRAKQSDVTGIEVPLDTNTISEELDAAIKAKDPSGIISSSEKLKEAIKASPSQEEIDTIEEELKKPLDPSRVKQNYDKMNYLEGYDIIDTANKIFGYFGWDFDSEVEDTGIGYRSKVKVEIYLPNGRVVKRSGIGYGEINGKNGTRTAKAEDTAVKAAETDAMKRAFRSFGAQFGNVLYDKEEAHNFTPAKTAFNSSRNAPTKPAYGGNNPTPQTTGWEPNWGVRYGPAAQYDENGKAISGRKVANMTPEERRWYYDRCNQDLKEGNYPSRNNALKALIVQLQPDIENIKPAVFKGA